MNAPSSGPIPMRLVAKVVPIHMKRVRSRNRSLFLVLAASLRANGINHLAPMKISMPRPTNFIITVGIVCSSMASPPRIGVRSITPITAMSWKIRIPKVTLP